MPTFIPRPNIDAFFSRLSARIVHKDGDKAHYFSGTDHIQLFPQGKVSSDFYYSVLFHEHAHWTGHATRLDRVLGQPAGSRGQAREEIVAVTAEIHLSFRFGVLGALDSSFAYGKKFYEIIKDDPALIRAAMHDGRTAVVYMHLLQSEAVPYHVLSPWAEKLLAENFPLPPEPVPAPLPVPHPRPQTTSTPNPPAPPKPVKPSPPRPRAPIRKPIIVADPAVRERLAPLIAKFGTAPRPGTMRPVWRV
ncbi:zincin-like metallopeptidase domain-containing protein [Bradyrhizobium acaciae]|uniref:zincin-like metallopeptidase domain-containing protein n=1 Tax=Bradyrhizobium acaciae TaxID=2683706 RepID=UPI001E55B77A|nr:zincin-like metallopeptidase domain-containing protein [Bradyrhizobium acaciae]MCC8978887.1 hypothetical protein [Bradyrhizobium acaciae]